MSARLSPALIAVMAGAVLVVVLFVPYVARQYRRRGSLGFGHTVLSLTALLYALGLLAYVSVPLPLSQPDFCARYGVGGPQLRPLQFLSDIRKDATGTGVAALLHNPAVAQVLLNIALFVPLGLLVRYMFRRGIAATTAVGFGVSLFIEVTQLTGMWFLLPCPYRLFDVDDLAANTLGALLGAVAAPVLSLIPGQRSPAMTPGAPRPVTARRRLLGMICDLLAFQLIAILLGTVVQAVLLGITGGLTGQGEPVEDLPGSGIATAIAGTWLPWVLLFVVFPLAGSGASLGQRVVQLGASGPDGARPPARQRLARSMAGVGGYLLLTSVAALQGVPPLLTVAAWLLSIALAVASVAGVWFTRGRRGLSYAMTGLELTDTRSGLESERTTVG